jgi:hypothetical protein
MSDQVLFDRLTYIDKLQGAGIPADQARAHADALDSALRDSVATKTDVAELGTALKSDIAELRTATKADFAAVRADLKTEITAVRADLKTEITAVRADLKTEIAAVRADMALGFRDATIRTGGMLVVAVGVLTGVIKFFTH